MKLICTWQYYYVIRGNVSDFRVRFYIEIGSFKICQAIYEDI